MCRRKKAKTARFFSLFFDRKTLVLFCWREERERGVFQTKLDNDGEISINFTYASSLTNKLRQRNHHKARNLQQNMSSYKGSFFRNKPSRVIRASIERKQPARRSCGALNNNGCCTCCWWVGRRGCITTIIIIVPTVNALFFSSSRCARPRRQRPPMTERVLSLAQGPLRGPNRLRGPGLGLSTFLC